jgi:nucleoside-diphosphate-sugar epimerase
MKALVIGASGFVAGKLIQRLLNDEKIGDSTITDLILADLVKPSVPTSPTTNVKIHSLSVDITDADSVRKMLEDLPNVIFHLAAIVSGDAEKNFDLGYKVNVDGTRLILDIIRENENYTPRFVFTSSLAVYGTPVPPTIPDDYQTTPRGSYGTQKAIAELFLEDYTRRGYVDAVSIRFPTIAIRPGKPNKAASSFVSGIIREPLNGVEAVLPVKLDFRHPVASPQKAVEGLIKAALLEPKRPGDRTFNIPSLCVSVKEMIEALERVAGKKVTGLIKHEPDPFILGVVENWPQGFSCQKAIELGFTADKSYDDIIRGYMKDELGAEPNPKVPKLV